MIAERMRPLEDARYIMVTCNVVSGRASSLKVDLPRYGLEFFIDEDGDLPEWIQLEEFGPLLLAAAQVDVDELVGKLLLGKHDSYLLAEGALRIIIELHRINHLLARAAD